MPQGSTSVNLAALKSTVGERGGPLTPPSTDAIVSIVPVAEQVDEGAQVVVRVDRVGFTQSECSVELTLTNPTGGQPGFVDLTPVVVNIGAGVTAVQVPLDTQNVTGTQGSRNVKVTISQGFGCIISADQFQAQVTINDAVEASLSIAPAQAALTEPATGSVLARFVVTRGGDTAVACSCTWTKSGTTSNADFNSPPVSPGSISFLAGELTKNIDFDVKPDALTEGTETIIVTLSVPVNCVIPNPTNSATITLADQAVVSKARFTAAASPDSIAEGASSAQKVDFMVNRAGEINVAASVDWTVALGAGLTDNDFAFDVAGGTITTGWPYHRSALYSRFTWTGINRYAQGNDQWPCSEDAAGRLLFVGADGTGFTGVARTEWRVSRVTGTPPAGLTGVDLNMRMDESAPLATNSSKPQGILAFDTNRIAVFYSFLSDQPTKAGQTHVALSADNGSTFTLNDAANQYIVREGSNEDLMVWGVLQLGPGYAQAGGVDNEYIYVYLVNRRQTSTDQWDSSRGGRTIWLARVKWTGTGGSIANISNRAAYQMFTGLNTAGNPTWGAIGDFVTNKTPVYFDDNGTGLFFNVQWHPAFNKFVASYIHCSNGAGGIANQSIAIAVSSSPWDRNAWRMLAYDRLAPTAADETGNYMSVMAPARWNDGTNMYVALSTYVVATGGGSGDNLIVTKAALGNKQFNLAGKFDFAVAELQKSNSYYVMGDTQIESNEVMTLSLSNPLPANAAEIGNPGTATITIRDDDSVATSPFVKQADLYWKTLPASSISRPANVNAEDVNNFNPGANRGIDLRGREFRNHIAHQQGRVTPVNLTAANGAVVFGFKCRGMQPKTLTWQDMKFGSGATGSLSPDDSWDDKHFKVNGSINGTVYAECFASYDSMDGVDTGDAGNHDHTLIMQTFYARGNRDDWIQNDQLKHIICRDFLIDGAHFFVSCRPGGSLETTEDIEFENGIIRLSRNTYHAGQNPGSSSPQNQSLYSGYWNSPTDRGTPELSNNQNKGFAHNQVVKDSGGFKGQTIMKNIFILMESKPLGGPSSLVWPPGTYTNVECHYVGETPVNLGPVPSGVTLFTNDRVASWNAFNNHRTQWLELHGNFDGTGNDFDFLHQ